MSEMLSVHPTPHHERLLIEPNQLASRFPGNGSTKQSNLHRPYESPKSLFKRWKVVCFYINKKIKNEPFNQLKPNREDKKKKE